MLSEGVLVVIITVLGGIAVAWIGKGHAESKPPISSGRTEGAPGDAQSETLGIARMALSQSAEANARAAAASREASDAKLDAAAARYAAAKAEGQVMSLRAWMRRLVQDWRALAQVDQDGGRSDAAAARRDCALDLETHLTD